MPCACCWPKPRRNQASTRPGVVRRNECVLARPSLLDPAGSRSAVQVAEVLGLLDRVPRELDPDVLAPDLDVARRADQVAHDSSVAQPRGAGSALRAPGRLDLFACGGGVFIALRQGRLGLAVVGVTGREQPRRIVEMRVGKGDDLGPGHGT